MARQEVRLCGSKCLLARVLSTRLCTGPVKNRRQPGDLGIGDEINKRFGTNYVLSTRHVGPLDSLKRVVHHVFGRPSGARG